jgi:transcriptional regulator with XRE-family HTH domain
MELHYGQIIEKRIRNSGYSIAEVARLMGVNRRSVYNWFNCEKLNKNTIERIGYVLKCDFSLDFPNLFEPGHFASLEQKLNAQNTNSETLTLADVHEDYWKDKYIVLLEAYKSLLQANS